MPGFNGTGPMGMGPMTGGARGLCNYYGRFSPPGPGFRATRYAFPPYRRFRNRAWMPVNNEQQNVDYLKNQAALLKEELKDIENEIEKFPGK